MKSSKKAKAQSLTAAAKSNKSLPTAPTAVKSSGGRQQGKEKLTKPWAGAKLRK